MALVSTFFQMFIVLGMYNFGWCCKESCTAKTWLAFLADTCSQNISSSWLKQLSRPAACCYFMSTSANNYYAKKSVKATADSCLDSCPVGRKIARASMYNAHQCSGRYGNTDCRVFKQGVQNWKDFCLEINIPQGNYWILRIGVTGRFQKLDIVLENVVI
jgi:hypothetical protein